jgi:hypothetical protein
VSPRRNDRRIHGGRRAGADAAANCGTFPSDGAAVHAKVIRGRSACATARRVLRAYLGSSAPCSGSACVRSHFGWMCATAAWSAFPRLASCSRRRAVIAANSTAD